ncbi:hypothetical protein PsorP6_011498 [Peronosclerospora sorghi]|uniref:Uncharacterized protein n=1 Tax=Peronosclerospora sorghi TaxID=230839 RepID=A0ACC0WJS5_9STRA|nr:hypothetical protein PsorP6_011498 [Peronosclerospora sorghi]
MEKNESCSPGLVNNPLGAHRRSSTSKEDAVSPLSLFSSSAVQSNPILGQEGSSCCFNNGVENWEGEHDRLDPQGNNCGDALGSEIESTSTEFVSFCLRGERVKNDKGEWVFICNTPKLLSYDDWSLDLAFILSSGVC